MRKSVVVKSALKSCLPFQSRLRALKRRVRPYHEDASNNASTISDGLTQIRLLQSQNIPLTGTVLEIGSGWLPIIPLLFHIAGAEKLVLTDVDRLMDAWTILRAKAIISERIDAIAAALGMAVADVSARLQSDFSPDYLVPWDPRMQPTHSVDIIVSRACFEHIRPNDLSVLLDESARILKPSGAMCHVIDNSDHWSHSDESLSRIDFLRYEDGPYWRLCERAYYQNRLRHSDYAKEFRRHGWNIVAEEGGPHAQSLADLQTLPLASQFRGRDPRDLAILISAFVLRRSHAT